MGEEPSFTLVAGGEDLFRRYPIEETSRVAGELIVNPLYAVTRAGDRSELTLTFPTPEYEEEFGGCRRYMPDSVTLPGDLSRPLRPETFGRSTRNCAAAACCSTCRIATADQCLLLERPAGVPGPPEAPSIACP